MEMESEPLEHVREQLRASCSIVPAGSNTAQEAPNADYLWLGPIAAREAAKFGVHLLGYLLAPGLASRKRHLTPESPAA